MAWVKIDDNAPHHRKQLLAGPVACWLWVCGLAYANRHATDGLIPSEAVPYLGCKEWQKAVPMLLKSGLWLGNEPNGYIIHDFLQWNDSAASRKAKTADSAERVTRYRERVKRDGNGVTPLPSGNACNMTPQPSPQPLPQPTPQPSSAKNAEERGGVVMSPAEYAKLQRFNAYVGARLRVPHKLHGDFVAALGGDEPDTKLRAWYAEVDAEVEISREAIVPDVWKWLDARFKSWAVSTAVDPEWAKIEAWAKG
jgi:hypothetical protein